MATASSQSWLDEELTCSICLQVYTDPVTLACQHSYCRSCIEEFSPQSCPECRAELPGFRRLHLAKGAGDYLAVAPAAAAAPNSMLCSYCNRRQAVKTCLKCEASMCPIHLKLHTANRVFKTHPLVDTSADLSVWRCAEHERLLDIYCKEDKVCICTLCTLIGKHKGHNCGSISEGEQELR
eukprot:g28720.t1